MLDIVFGASAFVDAALPWTLVTLRSNDQFNTTVYGFSDRLRGLGGSRDIILINREEMERLKWREGQRVTVVSDFDDGIDRRVEGLTVTPYDLPPDAWPDIIRS
ncbi:hypothetical protein [Martelella endophytica]|uniref:hypothetical protein n=1 Tax=Martelella endophytica TaxID=1486262 RepID=UPI000A859A00|nr:hypothetical protein [Martelella endophytica]